MKCIAASPHSRAASVQPCGTPSPCVERSACIGIWELYGNPKSLIVHVFL
jgi:hypothetical protein